MDAKRTVLLGARMRFSPAGASIREEAIDRILEQNLAYAGESGLAEDELRETIRLPGGNRILTAADTHAGLQRLIGCGRVLEKLPKGSGGFILSTEANRELERTIDDVQNCWNSVVKELFDSARGALAQYGDVFIQVLCHVFARMSAGYVAVLVGKDTQKTDTHHLIQRAIDAVLKERDLDDRQAFELGITRFFQESTPRFDAIKWNMAQNFYVAVALGIDPKARVLSSELLSGAVVFFDTNVLIPGLIPEDRHHAGFQEVVKTCHNLGIKIKVAQITVDELRRVIAAHSAELKRVYDRIPASTMPKVRCFLLEAYQHVTRKEGNLPLDDFLARFQAPIDTLRDIFAVEIEDDAWFDRESNSQETEKLALALGDKFKSMRHRGKTSEASRHDALLLRWIDECRGRVDHNCRIATLDMTLIAAEREAMNLHSRAISLDALLQWASPHCSSDATVEQVAAIYSSALKYQLLPAEQFLDARDFRVFAEMEIETAQLPVEDVENCVREIRKYGPNLDPARAEDREKIAKTIQRFFADPGRKFKQAMAELEAKNTALGEALKSETDARRKTETNLADLKKDAAALSDKNKQLDVAIASEKTARETTEQRLTDLQSDLSQLKESVRRSQLSRSIIFRCIPLAVLLAVGFAIVGVSATRYGEGGTTFQRLTNSWEWHIVPLGVVLFLFPFVMGRERMRHLRWWKGEDD